MLSSMEQSNTDEDKCELSDIDSVYETEILEYMMEYEVMRAKYLSIKRTNSDPNRIYINIPL
jgi:hypothetical protein